MNKESFFEDYEVIIMAGVSSNPMKPEALYDRFDHASTVMITSYSESRKYI